MASPSVIGDNGEPDPFRTWPEPNSNRQGEQRNDLIPLSSDDSADSLDYHFDQIDDDDPDLFNSLDHDLQTFVFDPEQETDTRADHHYQQQQQQQRQQQQQQQRQQQQAATLIQSHTRRRAAQRTAYRVHMNNNEVRRQEKIRHDQIEQKNAACKLQARVRMRGAKSKFTVMQQERKRQQNQHEKNIQIARIQAVYRGKQSRDYARTLRREQKRQESVQQQEIASTRLQQQYRGIRARKKYRVRIKEQKRRMHLQDERNIAASHLQRMSRGRSSRKKVQDQQKQQQITEKRRRDNLRHEWEKTKYKELVDVLGTESTWENAGDEFADTKIEFYDATFLASASAPPSLPDFTDAFSHLTPSEAVDVFVNLTKERDIKQTLLTNLIQKERSMSTTLNVVSRSLQEKKRRLQRVSLSLPQNPDVTIQQLEKNIQESRTQLRYFQHKAYFMKKKMKKEIEEERVKVVKKTIEFQKLMASLEVKKCDQEDVEDLLAGIE
jgi:hypothetical protein